MSRCDPNLSALIDDVGQLMTIYDVIREMHVIAGTFALAAFWTAATLRKGSGGHRVVGRVFMVAMVVVSITALVIAFAAFGRGQPLTGMFLLYIVLITVTACWLAWRAVRDKRDVKRYTGSVYHALAWVNVAAGIVMLALGIGYRDLITGVLSSVGLIAGAVMLRFARREQVQPRWWLERHFGSILGAGVATHVAFLNIGLTHLLPPELGATAHRLSWFAPFAIALVARAWLRRMYVPA